MDTKNTGDARFNLCPDCEKHGHIVFSDGTKSEEIFDEDSALLVIKDAVKQKKLSVEDSVLLRTMVQSVKLPDYSYFLVVAMQIIDLQQKTRAQQNQKTFPNSSDDSLH